MSDCYSHLYFNSYPAEETIPLKTQQPDPHSAKDEEKEIPHKHGDSAVEPTQQRSEGEHISADGSSEMPLISLNESDAESCGHSTPDTQTSESLSAQQHALFPYT